MTHWRQGQSIPHHVYAQRGDEPDTRPWPDGDPPVATFLDPDDAELAVRAVNAWPATPGYRDGFHDGAQYARDHDAMTARMASRERGLSGKVSGLDHEPTAGELGIAGGVDEEAARRELVALIGGVWEGPARDRRIADAVLAWMEREQRIRRNQRLGTGRCRNSACCAERGRCEVERGSHQLPCCAYCSGVGIETAHADGPAPQAGGS